MARENFVLKTLQEKGEVEYKPHGNSMTPILISGEQIKLKQVPLAALRVGDAVYCKVKGNYYCHLLLAIDESQNRYCIGNNHGHTNGWINGDKIFGLCVQAKEKVLVSDEELAKRMGK